MPPGRTMLLWLPSGAQYAPTLDMFKEKHTLWHMVGTLSEISERGQSSSVGSQNAGKGNVLSTLGRRGAGGLPDVPPGCLEALIWEARHRMIILSILIILQSSYLLFAPG